MDRKTAASGELSYFQMNPNVISMDLIVFMCRMPTKLDGGRNVKAWGCFSCSGVGELVFIDTNTNSEVYRGILDAYFAESSEYIIQVTEVFSSEG